MVKWKCYWRPEEENWVQFSSCSGVHGSYLQGRSLLFEFHGMGRILRGKDGGAFLTPGKACSQKKHKTCLVWVNRAITLCTWHLVDLFIWKRREWLSEWLQKSLSSPYLWWQGSYKGRLLTNKHTDPSAHFSPSLDSTFVELPCGGDWRSFIFTHYIEFLKPTFLLCLHKVLVLHLSEKAANCHPSLEPEQRPYYYFPWKSHIVYPDLHLLSPLLLKY